MLGPGRAPVPIPPPPSRPLDTNALDRARCAGVNGEKRNRPLAPPPAG